MLVEPNAMPKSVFVAGDWGTTNLRLYLCEFSDTTAPVVLDTYFGPGVSKVEDDFEQIFFDLTSDWLTQYGPVPVILSGMVGSSIGWMNAPYLQCPVSSGQIVSGHIQFKARGIEFSLVCGLRTDNPLGAPDLMRGEELQLLGWMRSVNDKETAQVVVLPGTHNKWALVKGDKVETFVTALTGEVFALLENHSVLIADAEAAEFSPEIFMQGVNVAQDLQTGQLLHALFTTRSRQVVGELSELHASSYLSGLLIAADIIGSVALMAVQNDVIASVDLIGDSVLCERYQMALESFGMVVNSCNATQMAMAGYGAIYKTLYKDSL
jgi:2-dehydro-3-deoxygalactonokinase